MKNSFKLHDVQQKAKEEEAWVKPQPCMVCKKVVAGAYGMWAVGWTCSLVCEATYQKEKLCTATNAARQFELTMDISAHTSTVSDTTTT